MRKLLAVLVAAFAAQAQAGTSGSSWLMMPTDAHTAALAGATGAWVKGAESFGANLSGLADTVGTEAVVAHSFWAQDISREHVGAARKMTDQLSLGLSADYLSYGSIDTYEVVNGVPVANGNVKPNALSVGAAGAYRVTSKISAGAQVKFLREDLGGVTDSTAAGDIGAGYADGAWALGLGASNVGGKLNEADLPSTASLSASYKWKLAEKLKNGKSLRQDLGVMAQGDWVLHDSNQNAFGLGAEYSYAETLSLRAGYRGTKYGELTGVKGLTCGIGVRVKKMELSYALVTLGDLGSSSLLSLKAGF